MIRVLLLLAAVVLLPGCRATGEESLGQVVSVTLHARYYASKHVSADGWASGHHQSKDPKAPMVHQDRRKVPDEQRKAIWNAVSALGNRLHRTQMKPTKQMGHDGYYELTVTFEDGPAMRLCWPRGQEHPNPQVRRLAKLVRALPVGAW